MSQPEPLASRRVALDVLDLVLGRRRLLDEALASHAGGTRLSSRDRRFVRLLVTTCLRRLGQIDALIEHALDRPLPPRAKAARDLLRMGTCQLVFVGTPAHAAVSSSVDLARGPAMVPYRGLINAVLRRLAREGRALAARQDAACLNTPSWLWDAWSSSYGTATCRAVALAHLAEAPTDLTVKADAAAWARRLGARVLPTGTLRLRSQGPVGDLPGYGEGTWWVQDAAAALPARLLGELRGLRVIDLCAAPGGKTAQLCVAGARVVAVDRSAARLDTLRKNLGRLHLEAEIVNADATDWRPRRPADAVLVDAPCTGTGVIRRHPDILHLKRPGDVGKLAAVQERLLAGAVAMVKPGGMLLYCTCSLEPEEGPDRIGRLLARGAPLARVPIRVEDVAGLEGLLTPEGDLRTLPIHLPELGGMDGFYAARLRRL